MMEALLELKDLKGEEDAKRRAELESRIDELLDSEIIIPDESEMEINDYLLAPVDPYALTVFGGYIARKVRSMKPAQNCTQCCEALCKPQDSEFTEREALLRIRTHGRLLRPADTLRDLLVKVRNLLMRLKLNESCKVIIIIIIYTMFFIFSSAC